MQIYSVKKMSRFLETMTELLQKAIAEISKLSNDQQNAIASRLLAELKDENAWQERFEATTDSQWDNLASMVRQEIASGKIFPSDDVFSVDR